MIFIDASLVFLLLVSELWTSTLEQTGHGEFLGRIYISEKRNEPYIFPEIRDGNALQPTLQLLSSQKKHHEEVESIFKSIVEKMKEVLDIEFLKSIDGDIIHIGEVINDCYNTIEGYKKNKRTTAEQKQEPLNDISSWMLLHMWETIKDWSNNALDYVDTEDDEEFRALQEPLDLAIREMKAYRNYAGEVSEGIPKLANESFEKGWEKLGAHLLRKN